MKIVILDGYALNPGDLSYDCLKAFGELTVYEGTDSEEAAIARIGDAEIVLINKVPITESLLAACPSIRLICVQATGYNVVDCAACASGHSAKCFTPPMASCSLRRYASLPGIGFSGKPNA